MIEIFSNSNFFFSTLFLLGLVVGSFINVVAYRLPKILNDRWRRDSLSFLEGTDHESPTLSLSLPGSHCPNCKTAIKPWENIPLISYIFLKGHCSYCFERISARYPIIEFLTAIFTMFLGYQFEPTIELVASLVLAWTLICLSLIDIDHKLLPDDITLPLLWLGLLVNSYNLFVPLHSAVAGAMVGYGILWGVYWLFKICTGKEGMGYGDFKLLSALGAWLGWEALPTIILLASFAGASAGIFLIFVKRRDKEIPMAFGPYLAISGMLILIYRKEFESLTNFSILWNI